jgi:N-acetyltransferase
VTDVTLPDAGPLTGRYVRLDLLTESDADALYPLLADPELYASGYVKHRRPSSVADARDLVRERFLAGQGCADGRGGGRTA